MAKEIEIPEGYEAKIENNKVIFVPKESEDEKIRKELLKEIEFITPRDGETDGEGLILPSYHARIDRYKSYLEKQKEQKPIFKKGDKVIWDDEEFNILDVNETEYNVGGYRVPFSRQNELHPIWQKSAEWSEDYREEDIQTRFAFYTYKDDPSVLYLSNVFVEEASRNHGFGTRILRAAEKVAEVIGATTISLKVKQDSPANAWYRKNGYGYVTFEDGYDWLEKNLEYMKPCKQEWSEEFLRLMGITISQDGNQVCVLLGENLAEGIAGFGDTLADAVEEFKKEWRQFDRFRKATWKPSEVQMEALSEVIGDERMEDTAACEKKAEILESLYNDLKKL